jgi:hypothetical protein
LNAIGQTFWRHRHQKDRPSVYVFCAGRSAIGQTSYQGSWPRKTLMFLLLALHAPAAAAFRLRPHSGTAVGGSKCSHRRDRQGVPVSASQIQPGPFSRHRDPPAALPESRAPTACPWAGGDRLTHSGSARQSLWIRLRMLHSARFSCAGPAA